MISFRAGRKKSFPIRTLLFCLVFYLCTSMTSTFLGDSRIVGLLLNGSGIISVSQSPYCQLTNTHFFGLLQWVFSGGTCPFEKSFSRMIGCVRNHAWLLPETANSRVLSSRIISFLLLSYIILISCSGSPEEGQSFDF